MGKYQIVFNRLKVLSKKDATSYSTEMMSHPFSEEEGWGYSDVQRVENTVYATLQKRISAYYSVWNEELQQVERQCFQIVTEAPFEIDFQRGLLIAEGSNAQLNRIKQSFRQVFWNEFVYEDINLMPVDYIAMLNESRLITSIGELTINDFQYEGCLIGRYIAKPTSQFEVVEKIGEHAKNIIRAKIRITLNGEEAQITVSNRSVLSLDASEDCKIAFVNYLKQKLV